MRRTRHAGTLTLALLGLAGCGTPAGDYWTARALDLADAVPVSFANGVGLGAEVRVTPFVGVGAGWAEVERYGFDAGRSGPRWSEREWGIPLWSYERVGRTLEDAESWPGGDPEEAGDVFARAATFVVWPQRACRDDGVAARWSAWEALDVEVGLVLGFLGLRVGFSPLQTVDLLAGLLDHDPAGDDPEVAPR
ncbi:MAG: hypothetical protein ACF8XB_24955 [Planctomycetota bacterium JB042]